MDSAWWGTDGVLLQVPGRWRGGEGSVEAGGKGGAIWTPIGVWGYLLRGAPGKQKPCAFVELIRTASLDKRGLARHRDPLEGFRHHLREAEGRLTRREVPSWFSSVTNPVVQAPDPQFSSVRIDA